MQTLDIIFKYRNKYRRKIIYDYWVTKTACTLVDCSRSHVSQQERKYIIENFFFGKNRIPTELTFWIIVVFFFSFYLINQKLASISSQSCFHPKIKKVSKEFFFSYKSKNIYELTLRAHAQSILRNIKHKVVKELKLLKMFDVVRDSNLCIQSIQNL